MLPWCLEPPAVDVPGERKGAETLVFFFLIFEGWLCSLAYLFLESAVIADSQMCG